MKRSRNYPENMSGTQKILIVGLGRAGMAAASFAAKSGGRVVVTDSRGREHFKQILALLPESVELELGGHRMESFLRTDLIVVSPGVGPIEELKAAAKAGIPVIDEAQFAASLIRGELIAVTGTNGKSTTSVLLARMLRETGRPVFVGGNLGNPLTECLSTEACNEGGLVVAELSSFQLQRSPDIAPSVAVLLNLNEDHLDRHKDMEEYAEAKEMIFRNQTSDDWALVNGDQEICISLARKHQGRLLYFSDRKKADSKPGGYLDGDTIVIALPDREEVRIFAGSIPLHGRHNLTNACAAAIIASLYGADSNDIQNGLRAFEGLPHRMQKTGILEGVTFYNDSKATNVSAAVGTLQGLEGRFVLIAGGRHKGSSYSPLLSVLQDRCDALVLIGEAAKRMKKELGGAARVVTAGDMKEALYEAYRLASPGSSVVLCPACSSYDMFEDYEKRGDAFAEAFSHLSGEEKRL